MKADARRVRQALQIGNGLAALTVSACLLGLFAVGFAAVPALGRALVPGHGAWTSAAGAKLPVSQTLTLAGLTRPVRVAFTKQGLASIAAQSDDDAYLALGYVHAEFRLTEMDLERRLAEGRLAQLVGASAVASDTFELRLGLLRTAQQEWAAMPSSSPAAVPWLPTRAASTTTWRRRGPPDVGPRSSRWPGCTRRTGRRWTAWPCRVT